MIDIYEHLIDTPFSEAGYNVMRADDILNQQNILADIIQSIKDSDFIVADLSKANPNVYYELGLAHACEKNVIMIVEENTKIPFDLSTYRAIQYGTNFVQMKEAEKNIKKLIKDIQAGQSHYKWPCDKSLARYLWSHPALSRLVWMPALVVLSCWSRLSAMWRITAIFSGPCPRRMRD